jgi:hypothetical protein
MDKIENMMGFLPDYLVDPATALIVIVIGLIVAWFAGKFVAAAINRTGLGRKAQTTGGNIGTSIGKAVFWIVWLVFFLSALSGVEALSGPDKPLASLNGMLDRVFEYVPNIIAGLLIGAIGWIVSKVAMNATTSTLEAAQIDSFANRMSFNGDATQPTNKIAKALGGLVFGVLILLFAEAVFRTVGLTSISDMLGMISDYIPKVLAATIILVIFIIIGRFIANLAEDTLPSLGFDSSLQTISGLDGEEASPSTPPSKIVGIVAFVGITLMGLMAAFNALGIEELTNVFETILEFGGRIATGAVIIGAGFFVASFIARVASQAFGDTAGTIIKYVAVVLVTFMGLSQMGIGEDIVQTAFSYGLGAAAFAAGVGGALAFGLGGRDWAKGKLGTWFPNKPKPRAKKK